MRHSLRFFERAMSLSINFVVNKTITNAIVIATSGSVYNVTQFRIKLELMDDMVDRNLLLPSAANYFEIYYLRIDFVLSQVHSEDNLYHFFFLCSLTIIPRDNYNPIPPCA